MGWGQASLPLDQGLPPGGRGGRAPHTHGWTCQSACPYSSPHLCQQLPQGHSQTSGDTMRKVVREETHGRIQVYGIWAWAGNSRISGDPKYDPASGGVVALVPISTTGRGTAGGGSARAPAQKPFGQVFKTRLFLSSTLVFNFMPPLPIQKSKIIFKNLGN